MEFFERSANKDESASDKEKSLDKPAEDNIILVTRNISNLLEYKRKRTGKTLLDNDNKPKKERAPISIYDSETSCYSIIPRYFGGIIYYLFVQSEAKE